MERASRYFSGEPHQATLNKIPAYVLGRIKGEALAMHAARPENGWVTDQACVIIGYIEAFAWYPKGEFPWGHVAARLERMRTIIAQAEDLATQIKRGNIIADAPLLASVKTVEKALGRVVRYEGRWVSRIWYARHGTHAA